MSVTDLKSLQVIQGASFTEYAGRLIAESFTTLEEECHQVDSGVGALDLSWVSMLEFKGTDRSAFLHNLTTNHVLNLKPFQWQNSTVCNIKGHLEGVIRLLNTGESLLALMHPGCLEGVFNLLNDHLVMEDVQINLSPGRTLFSLQGPLWREAMQKIAINANPISMNVQPIRWADMELLALQSSHTGADGIDLICPNGGDARLWGALVKAVEGVGGSPVGLAALRRLRVIAGIPWWGEDLDSSVLMLEARLDDAIHFDKGCYLGQETLSRVHFRGHTNSELKRLEVEGEDPVRVPCKILCGEQEAGIMTSTSLLIHDRHLAALGFVRHKFLQETQNLHTEEGRLIWIRS